MTSVFLWRPSGRSATRLIFALGGIVLGAWAPLVPVAKQRLGVDEGILGLLLLCMGVGSILAMPLGVGRFSRFQPPACVSSCPCWRQVARCG